MRALSGMVAAVLAAVLRRPLAVIAIVLVVAGAAVAVAVLRLDPPRSVAGLVGSASPSADVTERAARQFGGDPIVVMISGPLPRLVLTGDLDRSLGLEGCLAGRQRSAGGPCARLAALQPVAAVAGPGTFVNTAATQISEEYERRVTAARRAAESAAADARRLARARGWSEARGRRAGEQAAAATLREAQVELLRLGVSYGILSPPTINDQSFVARLVFAGGREAGSPKARFASLFPNRQTALISVRLREDLGERERAAAIVDIRAAVAMPRWQPRNGGRYTVTGVPLVADELGATIGRSLRVLLALAAGAMALTLLVVFDVPRRLVPLAVALVAAAVTFGVVTLVGVSLTLAAVAALPVLVGLVVDHALQLQSRVHERRRGGSIAAAVGRAGREDLPTIAVAALTTAAGACALVLSPVPVVRGFGLLIAGGVVVGFALALTFGVALIVAGSGRRRAERDGAVVASLRGARELIVVGPPARMLRALGARLGRGTLALAERRRAAPALLAAGLIVAGAGIALESRIGIESDVDRLAPQDLPALVGARDLQRRTGIVGQIDVVVEARDVTAPSVIAWMTAYRRAVLREVGYSERQGCGRADLCPAFSLTDLPWGEATPTSEQVRALLASLPSSLTRGVLAPDHTMATITFGVRLMSLERQHRLVQSLRSALHPPAGVRAQLAGTTVLAADGQAAVSSPPRRLLMLAAGLLIVAVLLRVLLGRWRRALVPLLPIVVAVGWASLLSLVLGVRLNPLSVTLSALVVAIATEFSVLLSERYARERRRGADGPAAVRRTYRATGASVLASGATATVGFAVLTLSDVPLLRGFGVVAVIDLIVAIVAVMLVLPVVLVRWGPRE